MRISDIAAVVVVVGGRRASTVNTNTPFLILFTMKLKCVDRMQMLVRVDWEKESVYKFPRKITENWTKSNWFVCAEVNDRKMSALESTRAAASEWNIFVLCREKSEQNVSCICIYLLAEQRVPCDTPDDKYSNSNKIIMPNKLCVRDECQPRATSTPGRTARDSLSSFDIRLAETEKWIKRSNWNRLVYESMLTTSQCAATSLGVGRASRTMQ